MPLFRRRPSVASGRPSIGPFVAAFLLAAGLLAVPASAPSPVAGIGPLPACRLVDILTVPRGYDDWAITQVDWILSLGPDYKPPDLVSVRDGGVAGGGLVRKLVIDDLKVMAAAAKKNGTPLVSWSPYRSYSQQKTLFEGYVRGSGYDRAVTFSARPGHSEHQLGLTIDFVAVGDHGLTTNWEVTRTGAWMAKNAWKYGWLMSYPKGQTKVTCYSYEPWHYRYVGRELAAKIHDSGLTIREYLWANYTMVDAVTGSPLPIAPSTPSAPGILGPSAEVPATSPPPATPEPTSVATPTATSPASSNAGAAFGVDPPVVVAGLLLLAALGLVVALGFLRRSRRG
jgi:D-alanyl-D-alanine carboxypeptidase